MTQPGDGNRTIQIDALTDVQLVPTEPPAATSLPPPLPRRTAQPSRARAIVLTCLATIAGLVFAMIAVHYLFPAPPPTSTVAPVHRVQLDQELVIRAGQ